MSITVEDIAAYVEGHAMSDPEFSREMRYFTGSLVISIDEASVGFAFTDGSLAGRLSEIPAEPEILISGTVGHWENMLREYPTPFYQCLQTTSIKHGLELNNSNAFYAYLPALNRLVALLRQIRMNEKVKS